MSQIDFESYNLLLDNFAEWTIQTAVYPGAGTGEIGEITYLVIGLTGEMGETLNKYKKVIRDKIEMSEVVDELTDVVWYACRLINALRRYPSLEILKSSINQKDKSLLWILSQSYTCASTTLSYLVSDYCEEVIENCIAEQTAKVLQWVVLGIKKSGFDPESAIVAKKEKLLKRLAENKIHGSDSTR